MQCRRLQFDFWVGKFPWRKDRLSTPVFLGFPGGSDSKEYTCNAGDLHSIPEFGRPPGGGHGYPLQHSCLENLWTEEPGRLQSMGSPRVRHGWATECSTAWQVPFYFSNFFSFKTYNLSFFTLTSSSSFSLSFIYQRLFKEKLFFHSFIWT